MRRQKILTREAGERTRVDVAIGRPGRAMVACSRVIVLGVSAIQKLLAQPHYDAFGETLSPEFFRCVGHAHLSLNSHETPSYDLILTLFLDIT